MTPTRIRWIDVARGLGIIIVIYAHTLSQDSLRYIFYSFHMPLFFFLAGIIFHHKKNEQFLPMLRKNIKTILVPYFFFALLSYFLWIFTISSWQPTFSEAQEHLFGILYGNNGKNIMFYNGVLWFLPCLFVTKVLFSSFTELSTKKRFLLLFIFFLSLVGYLFSKVFPNDKLLFGLETALTAVVFFGSGFIWNTQSAKINTFFQKHSLILFIVFTLFCLFFATLHFIIHGSQIDMRLNNLGNYFLFYLASFSGILSTLALSMAIHKNKILEYVGKKSLILFIWHLIIFSYLNIYILPLLDQSFLQSLRGAVLSIITTIFSITIILSGDLIYRKIKLKIKNPKDERN